MEKIQSTIHQTLEKYQEEIHKQHPSISVSELKSIWEFLGESKKTSEKRKRTAYQNYFVKKRGDIASKNKGLKFGEISKIISAEWNQFTEEEKNKYETKKEKEPVSVKDSKKNKMDIKNTNSSYVHLFENHTDDVDDINRIDFEQDEGDNDVELLGDEEDDDESGEDELDFNDLI